MIFLDQPFVYSRDFTQLSTVLLFEKITYVHDCVDVKTRMFALRVI